MNNLIQRLICRILGHRVVEKGKSRWPCRVCGRCDQYLESADSVPCGECGGCRRFSGEKFGSACLNPTPTWDHNEVMRAYYPNDPRWTNKS